MTKTLTTDVLIVGGGGQVFQQPYQQAKVTRVLLFWRN